MVKIVCQLSDLSSESFNILYCRYQTYKKETKLETNRFKLHLIDMKFLLFTVFIATAAALPRWDENGAYRIIDDDSITIVQPKIEDLIKIQPSLEPYYRYYQALADPELAKYYQALTDPTYSRYYQALADPIYSSYYKALEPYYYANLPAGVQYKASQPFVYNFKLVKDIDA